MNDDHDDNCYHNSVCIWLCGSVKWSEKTSEMAEFIATLFPEALIKGMNAQYGVSGKGNEQCQPGIAVMTKLYI